jgi:hypothetical protein
MNVKGLSEYADENNYTISSSKDDIGSGPVVPAFHVEKKYEGNWVDRKRSGSGQRVCYGVCVDVVVRTIRIPIPYPHLHAQNSHPCISILPRSLT